MIPPTNTPTTNHTHVFSVSNSTPNISSCLQLASSKSLCVLCVEGGVEGGWVSDKFVNINIFLISFVFLLEYETYVPRAYLRKGTPIRRY